MYVLFYLFLFIYLFLRSKKIVPVSHLKCNKLSDIGKMKEWIKKSNLDPLNPENIGLLKLFQVSIFFLFSLNYK